MADKPRVDRLELCQAIDLDAQLRKNGVILKQKTTGLKGDNGREFSGACSLCGTGDDRLLYWPDQKPPRFWCRRCKRGGSAIDYVMLRDGLTFAQVAKEYGKSNGDNGNGHHGGKVKVTTTPKIHKAEPPPADWQNNAMLLVADCETVLWSEQGAKARVFLRDDRGLSDETIKSWRLGYCPSNGKLRGLYCDRGITIPWFDGQGRLWKVNVKRPAGKPKYKAVGGSLNTGLLGVDRLSDRPDCFVVEGEFDAILLCQAIGDVADVLTLGGDTGRLSDRWLAALLPIKRFWIATDADDAGEKAADYWLDLVGERGQRVYPPMGAKDVSDAHLTGADLRSWALGHLGGMNPRLDAIEAELSAAEAEQRDIGQRITRLEVVHDLEAELDRLWSEKESCEDLNRLEQLHAEFGVLYADYQRVVSEQ